MSRPLADTHAPSDPAAPRPPDESAVWDGLSAAELAPRLGVSRLVLRDVVPSTMDVAHALGAAGAPGGTLVLADEQTAGRGRHGRSWESARGKGIWLTLLERPADASALDVLSLRLGIAAAAALDPFASAPVRVKWPNDLLVDGRKLAGILVEARWREGSVDWVAVGMGLNVRAASAVGAARLREGVARAEVLAPLVRALRAGCGHAGPLEERELADFTARDIARGRRAVAPAEGIVAGVERGGALIIDTDAGRRTFRTGSLVLTGES